jgi:hypothetical protein
VVIVVGSAAQLPDRLAMDGDPCCPVPDTWGDVAAWSTVGLVLALLDAGALVLGAAFLSFAVRSRWPGRRVVWLPLAAVPGCVGLIVLGLLLRALM